MMKSKTLSGFQTLTGLGIPKTNKHKVLSNRCCIASITISGFSSVKTLSGLNFGHSWVKFTLFQPLKA